MPKKLDILRLFEDKESLTPFHLANLLDIKPNYALGLKSPDVVAVKDSMRSRLTDANRC